MREAKQQQRPPPPQDASAVNRHAQVLKTKELQAEEQQEEEDKLDIEESKYRASLHRQLRKTKFCVFHLQGVCQYGKTCAFAHDLRELQGTPDLRKTKFCKNVNGVCQVPDCAFAHSEEELRSMDSFYKKTMCMWYKKGRCRNGRQCRFAHGIEELRSSGSQSSSSQSGQAGEPPPAPWPRDRSIDAPSYQQFGSSSSSSGPRPSRRASAVVSDPADVASPPSPPPYLDVGSNSASSTGRQHAEQARPSGCMASQKVAANQRPVLEPMFVQTVPEASISGGTRQLSQAEQLQRASARLRQAFEASRHSMQAEQGALQEQINRLHNLSTATAMIASACSTPVGSATLALQANIGSLASQVFNLTLQVSRFERSLQMRQAAVAFDNPSFGGLSSTLNSQASNLLMELSAIEQITDNFTDSVRDNTGLFGNTSYSSPQNLGTRLSSFRSS